MKRFLCVLLVLSLLLFGAIGCRQGNGKDNVIRVNEVTHSIFYAPFYVGISMGFFEDEGLTVELTNGGGADKSMTALLSGGADIGLMGPEAAIYVYLEGRENYVEVFGQLTKRDGSFLVSRRAEPDFDYSSMQGSTFIIGRKGGMPAMMAEYVLNQKGLFDGENITLNFDVPFNMMAGAFIGGQSGDYVTLFEPTASELERQGNGHIVASIGASGGEVPFTAFMATRSYISDNSDKIESFLRALVRSLTFVKTAEMSVLIEALRPHFPDTSDTSISDSLSSYIQIDAWMSDPVMTEESFDRLQTIMEHAGELSERAPYNKIVNNSYAKKVIA
ncbi:MAG: ABC transporter substrate-binding protein [Clostridia bacterium]|nr:ABC transporter substrate-binding protein [Clostridia bacterium]